MSSVRGASAKAWKITPHGVTTSSTETRMGTFADRTIFSLSAPSGCGYMVTLMTVGERQLAY